jgi:hypothetical protein
MESTLFNEPRTFDSLPEAYAFMAEHIDRPVKRRVTDMGNDFEFRCFPHYHADGNFTNIYDFSWAPESTRAKLHIQARPSEGIDLARQSGRLATTSGSFFVLLNKKSSLPNQTSLNLAIADGSILSLPVVDREALFCNDGKLTMHEVRAEGEFSLNGEALRWTGSRTGRSADGYAFGNGNIVVVSQSDPDKGWIRVLDESSRFTPPMDPSAGLTDVGFTKLEDGSFRSTAIATEGDLNIFAHDLVMRCPSSKVDHHADNVLSILSIGDVDADSFPDYATTVGPSLSVADYSTHPIINDYSLDKTAPPFADRRAARMVMFQTSDGRSHLRLFDGRTASPVFTGATPGEARDSIIATEDVDWGFFLDGGGTAKIWVVEDGVLQAYGNRHYLRWPEQGGPAIWVPDEGRPSSSFLTFEPRGTPSVDLTSEGREQQAVMAGGLAAAQQALLGFPGHGRAGGGPPGPSSPPGASSPPPRQVTRRTPPGPGR